MNWQILWFKELFLTICILEGLLSKNPFFSFGAMDISSGWGSRFREIRKWIDKRMVKIWGMHHHKDSVNKFQHSQAIHLTQGMDEVQNVIINFQLTSDVQSIPYLPHTVLWSYPEDSSKRMKLVLWQRP